mmetsp:Transcript_70651/g.204732  ORF Transcript_70651/g.204732 Transcript_70651/m.204732 type:complete len:243 (-) Transcript_70651:207-935(-)
MAASAASSVHGAPGGIAYAEGRIVSGYKFGDQPKVIGRPLPPLQVAAPKSPSVEIRWDDFNYPPLLRLIHFDISELQWKLRPTVRLLNCVYLLTTAAVVVNLFDTILLAAMGSVPVQWIIQAMLHVLLFPPAALGVFYLGYRGLAARDQALLFRYHIAQGALAAMSFFVALFPYRCINGVLRLAFVPAVGNGSGLSGLWVCAIFIESALWMINGLLGVLNIVRVRHASSPHGCMHATQPEKV